jgi:thioredoxin reductase
MYDLTIIGSGVAGMAASIYASRYKINHLIFGEKPGNLGDRGCWLEKWRIIRVMFLLLVQN